MNAGVRVLGFAAACAALFAVAFGVGRVAGPLDTEPTAAGHDAMPAAHSDDHSGGAGTTSAADRDVGGLEPSEAGYTLQVDDPQPDPGRQPVAFSITGPDGRPVTDYREQHERDLHLVVVRRDLTGYQHVHPRLDPATGRWRTEVDLTPGAWRLIADFRPAGGDPLVLGADLMVPGGFAPEPLGPDRLTAQVDGYDVTLAGSFRPGQDTVLTTTLARGGRPVTDLQPYLGAYGHLVSLRDGDVGYLHVHPDDLAGPGPEVAFHTEFPSPGRYRLFLDFRHDGAVHTAAFTVTVPGAQP